jgi:hypothetical protein
VRLVEALKVAGPGTPAAQSSAVVSESGKAEEWIGAAFGLAAGAAVTAKV